MLGPLEETLIEKVLPPRIYNKLEVAYRNSLRLLKLVNTLLDFSRLDEVEADGDGEAALGLARYRDFDLVLSDVMMPKLDGFDLLKALRGDERTQTIPVILLSARAGEESRVEGMGAGADDYLVKPFSARELLARVEAHLNLQRVRREGEQALMDMMAREQKARANAQVANRVKDDFLAMLSSDAGETKKPFETKLLALKWIRTDLIFRLNHTLTC